MRLYLLLALLLVPMAAGLQISPASTELTDQDSFEITIINDEQGTYTIDISVQGNLSEYLQVQPASVRLAPGERRDVQVQVQRPIALQPGTYRSLLVAERQRDDTSRTVSTVPSVAHRITYLQPREGQWLTSRLSTSSIIVGAPATFNLHLQNTGTQTIQNIQASIQIRSNDAVIHEQTFTNQELPLSANRRFTTTWTPPQAGTYEVRTLVEYAGKTARTQNALTAGSRNLEIRNITHRTLDETTRVDITVYNPYNQPYEQVEALITTPDASAQTTTIRLQPQEEGMISGFLEQTYNMTTTAQITISYPPNRLQTTYELTADTDEGQGFPWVLTLAIIALIILIYLRLNTLRKRGEHGQQ